VIVSADFETYYSSEYSLSRMSEVDYILDPRFQIIMCSIKIDHHPSEVYFGHKAVANRMNTIDWSRVAMLSHNMRFDGAILAWILGHMPALYLDTLSMARAMTHAVLGRSSLAAVAKYLGLGEKGHEVVQAIGKRLEDFTRAELLAYAGYCINDNDLCRAIFDLFMRRFPKRELRVIDLVLRMFIQPQVTLNPEKLTRHLATVRAQKATIMEAVNHIDPAAYEARTLLQVFSSSAKFSKLMEAHGVEVPMKLSPTTGKMIPALAKNDRDFKDLCADATQPPLVQALCAARIGAKSTLEETRTNALLNLSQRDWGDYGSAWCPVPLRYAAAHTGRFGGDGGLNFQNLLRDSPIRDAIEAPPGWRILHRDSSSIEAKMLATLARCEKLLRAYEEGRDVYSEFATEVYGYLVTKAMKRDRFVGKTCILGLGYQTGGVKLRNTLYIGQGGISVDVPLPECNRIVRHYRTTYKEIPDLWFASEVAIGVMIGLASAFAPGANPVFGTHIDTAVGLFKGIIEFGPSAAWLPNDLCIPYPNLRRENVVQDDLTVRSQAFYDDPYGQPRSLYGGKATENFCQALSRIVITDAAVRVQHETGYTPLLSTHDSLDYLVPDSEAQAMDDLLEREFAVRPRWAPRLPLSSEGGWGRTLAEAEHAVNN
jgi:DNA polymerase family A